MNADYKVQKFEVISLSSKYDNKVKKKWFEKLLIAEYTTSLILKSSKNILEFIHVQSR